MKIKLFAFFLAIFYFQKSSIYAENKIAYIDLESLMLNSLAGKSINLQLENKHKSTFESFKSIEKEIIEEEKKLLSQKNILSTSEYEKKLGKLKKKYNNYIKEKSLLVEKINNDKINSSNKLLSEINPLLANYSSKNSISKIKNKTSY